jgi:hypothetical protein
MHDRDESTPAPIPHLDPAFWEKHEGFRETFLLHYTEPKANETLRNLGNLLFDLSLEREDQGPSRPESSTRSELQAALADLRFLEGFLTSVGRGHIVSSLAPEDIGLSRFAAGQALNLGAIANRIEEELGPVKN